jgi:hypothetical protein
VTGAYQPRQAICRIPLVAGGKVPLVVRWSSLPVDSPIWAETFADHPECNVGYRLDDLVVIDCDSPERVAWWLEQGFPTDFVSRGREDRRSFWYRQPEDDDPLDTVRFVDWEIRGGPGAQCAVPPSVHPCGRRYEWLGPPVSEETWWEIPPAPADFLRGIKNVRAGHGAVEGWSVILEGEGRDNHLTSLAGFLHRYWRVAPGTLLDLLVAANQLVCIPPLSREALDRIARSVSRYEDAPLHYTIEVLDGDESPAVPGDTTGPFTPAGGYELVFDGTHPAGAPHAGGG